MSGEGSRPTWLLTGYFGRGSFGDDLMRDALRGALERRVGARVEIREHKLVEFGVPSPSRLLASARFLRALVNADLVLLAGGTHFHDRFGSRSIRLLLSYLAIFGWARLWGAGVVFVDIGIGELDTRTGRLLVRALLRIARGVSFRDDESLRIARAVAPRGRYERGADLALMLVPESRPSPSNGGSRVLGMALLPYFSEYLGDPSLDERLVAALGDGLLALRQQGRDLEYVLLPCFRGRPGQDDASLAARLAGYLAEREVPVEIAATDTPGLVHAFGRIDALIAMRYHAIALGYLLMKPLLAVSYDGKCRSLAGQIGLPDGAICDPGDLLSAESVQQRLAGLLDQRELHQGTLPPLAARQAAEESVDRLLGRLL